MLDTKNIKKQIIKYLLISAFFLIFALIYESFSHNVYSPYMYFAFLIPLFLSLIYGIIHLTKTNKYLNEFGMKILNCSVITLTIYSVIKGILEIYGTTNRLVYIYLIVGIILIIICIVTNLVYNLKNK